MGDVNSVSRLLTNYKPSESFFLPCLNLILKHNKCSRTMYEIFTKTNIKPICISKWSEKLNMSYSGEEWSFIFSLPFHLTKDSSLQWFQYRIVHIILDTNALFFKMNIKESGICSFCKSEQESLEHLFWYCT